MEVQEKMTATLMCEVPLSATQANWFMEETRLEQNTKYRMEQDGTLRRLTIHNVTTNDDGVYICEMKEGSRTVAELTVLGMVKFPLLSLLLNIKYNAIIKSNYYDLLKLLEVRKLLQTGSTAYLFHGFC